MGLPGTRSASPRPARVVSALPTAPADRPRTLAISPVLQGPGLSARYSATWRRSWPFPSRPFGAAAGAAGAVIGITSVNASPEFSTALACARFSPLPGILIAGEFPPGISGYNNDASSPFWQESTPFRLESGNFRANFRGDSRNSSRTAAGTDTVRHCTFSGAPARLLPPPSRLAAGRLARPVCLAVCLAGTLGGKVGTGKGTAGGRGYTYTERATTEKINTRNYLPGAPITIVLRAVRVYKSGSSREGLFRALPAHSPGPGGSGVGRYTERSTE